MNVAVHMDIPGSCGQWSVVSSSFQPVLTIRDDDGELPEDFQFKLSDIARYPL